MNNGVGFWLGWKGDGGGGHCLLHGTHCTGKAVNSPINSLSGKTQGIYKSGQNSGNLEILLKHREFGLLKL